MMKMAQVVMMMKKVWKGKVKFQNVLLFLNLIMSRITGFKIDFYSCRFGKTFRKNFGEESKTFG